MAIYSESKKTFYTFAEHLIEEIKKRPILWDKNHLLRSHRRKGAKEWEYLSALYRKPIAELKSKWRNIKDTFHKEAKKMNVPPLEIRDKPIIQYYQGQWKHFEKLLFLWQEGRHAKEDDNEAGQTQDQEDLIRIDNTATDIGKVVKYEITDSDDTDIGNDQDLHEANVETDSIAIHTIYNVDATDPIGPEVEIKKRPSKSDYETPIVKRRLYDINETEKIESDGDEDLHFAKSLVPFMRKLNPIRKLIVRNEIHEILLRELMCIRCKTEGPQPSCRCNF